MLENLRKKVKELEIKIRGWHCRRDREGLFDDPDYTGGGMARSSHWSGLHWSRDRSKETIERHHDTLHRDTRRHPSVALDAMS